jgi:outer membrane murein-binding lipoprotein Lpp
MAEGQTVIENGRVSTAFKTGAAVLGALITAGIIGTFNWQSSFDTKFDQKMDSTNSALAQINTAIAVLNVQFENTTGQIKDDITALSNRVTDLERRDRSDSNNN